MARRRRQALVPAVLLALLTGLSACGTGNDGGGDASGAPDAGRGAQLFANNCAVCHGPVGDGTTTGPPLVHEIYEPGHHSDEAFQVAVARGVQPHHWDFGPMPPVPGLDRGDVADIVAHVRALQQAAGIGP